MPDKLTNNLAPARKSGLTEAQKTSLLKLKEREQAILDNYPFTDLLHHLSEGKTQREIAAITGANLSSVSIYLSTQTGERQAAISEAKKASGIACYDKALAELEAVRGTDNPVEVQLARELARHWEKRGAIFNTALNEKAALMQSQQSAQPAAIPSFTIQIMPSGQANITQQAEVIDIAPEDKIGLRSQTDFIPIKS